MGMFYRIKQRRRVRLAKKGKATWGRTEPDGAMKVESKQLGTLSAKVIRADGTVEDLGVIAEIGKE